MKHPALNKNPECAKKVVSDSLGLVGFAIWLVNSVLNLPEEQVKFFKKFKLQKNCNQSCLSKFFGLVHASNNLLEWQAIELTFFAPWLATKNTNQSTFLLLGFSH